MFSRSARRISWFLVGLLLIGCVHPVRQDVDAIVCDLAARPLDVTGEPPAPAPEPMRTPSPVRQATPAKPPSKFEERLQLPPQLPGAGAELRVPPVTAPPQQKRDALKALFPPLPVVETMPAPQPGPYGHPLTLAELQQLAVANNPLIRQRAADVKAAEGSARQAGTYPNPNAGYEADTAGSGNTAGQQGFFVEQLIKTAGKLKLAEARAIMDLLNARLALRAARNDVMTQVRAGYFAVLVARENVKWSTALSEFTERVYGIFVENAVAGLFGPYEPLQLRAGAIQAQGSLVQAQNRYTSAWKQLASTLGLTDLPLTELAGSAEMTPPVFHREEALARILSTHTDILTARNSQQRARYDLRLAQVTPVPDVDVRLAVQKDFTMPPFNIVYSTQVGVTLPVWDQNKGGIVQAQGNLLRATEEEHRVRTDLTKRFADAFERYENNRILAHYYRERVLPDLSLVYTRTLLRFNQQLSSAEDRVAFVDVITNQQLYVTALATFATTLQSQWQAVADVANLLQTDDLFLGTEIEHPATELLPALPCSHPCNPLFSSAEPSSCVPAADKR